MLPYRPEDSIMCKAITVSMQALLLIICLGLSAGCSQFSSGKYNHDFKSGSDFSALKSYSWRKVDSAIDSISMAQLQLLADEQLQAQGFVKQEDNADMLLDLSAFSRTKAPSNITLSLGVGVPLGGNGSLGVGTGQRLGKTEQEGVIVVDILRRENSELLWRGSAEGVPLLHFKLSAEAKLQEVFLRLLSPFPPTARAAN
jgi:hypothetical protein